MRTADHKAAFGSNSLEATCETMLLGRLGTEIAAVYRDTLKSPLPPRLQELVDMLDDLTDRSGGFRRDRDTV